MSTKESRIASPSELIMETGKRGRTDAQAEIETTREQAVRIADSHQPEPLADEIKGGLERILADAHRAIKGA